MTKEQEAIERCKSIVRVNKDFLKGNKQTINQKRNRLYRNSLKYTKRKNVEIEEYKRMITTGIINAAKDELVQEKNKEIEKKDKQIDLMAEKIHQLGSDYDDFCIDTVWNEDCDEDCKECIKQYFERKANNEN